MAFRVRRHNDLKNETVTAPQNFQTGEAAFRAAMDNAVKLIVDHWDAGGAAGHDGPEIDHKFKIYIDRRPGAAEVQLRYDFNLNGVQDTNNIFWRVVQV